MDLEPLSVRMNHCASDDSRIQPTYSMLAKSSTRVLHRLALTVLNRRFVRYCAKPSFALMLQRCTNGSRTKRCGGPICAVLRLPFPVSAARPVSGPCGRSHLLGCSAKPNRTILLVSAPVNSSTGSVPPGLCRVLTSRVEYTALPCTYCNTVHTAQHASSAPELNPFLY